MWFQNIVVSLHNVFKSISWAKPIWGSIIFWTMVSKHRGLPSCGFKTSWSPFITFSNALQWSNFCCSDSLHFHHHCYHQILIICCHFCAWACSPHSAPWTNEPMNSWTHEPMNFFFVLAAFIFTTIVIIKNCLFVIIFVLGRVPHFLVDLWTYGLIDLWTYEPMDLWTFTFSHPFLGQSQSEVV